MTIIEKLSDRNGFIYEAILLVIKNNPAMNKKQLQYKLFECGVYLKAPLMMQALSVLYEKKLLIPPPDEEKTTAQEEGSKAPATIV